MWEKHGKLFVISCGIMIRDNEALLMLRGALIILFVPHIIGGG